MMVFKDIIYRPFKYAEQNDYLKILFVPFWELMGVEWGEG